jgi:hypothetical protein
VGPLFLAPFTFSISCFVLSSDIRIPDRAK